jgi:hypothetical protein
MLRQIKRWSLLRIEGSKMTPKENGCDNHSEHSVLRIASRQQSVPEKSGFVKFVLGAYWGQEEIRLTLKHLSYIK